MSSREAPHKIEVRVSGNVTTHHHFELEAGFLGELTCPAHSPRGIFRAADGRELLMRKASSLGSAQELQEGDQVRATAKQAGPYSRDIAIEFDGKDYVLEPESIYSPRWQLKDAAAATILEIEPRGIHARGAFLHPTGPLSLALVVFAYYLVHVRQQQEAAARSK